MKTSKRCFAVLCGVGFLLLGQGLLRAQDALEGISKHLFTPELVKMAQEAIGLTQEQGSTVKQELTQAHGEFAQLKEQLQAEVASLAALVSQEKPDEKAVLTQSDKVLGLERQIKQRHLALLVRIKSALTPEQQVQLTEIRAEVQAKKSVQAKLEKVKHLAAIMEQKERDISVLQRLKSELPPLLDAKKFSDAEALIDKALKQLDLKP